MNLDRVEAILKLLQRQEHVGELSVEGSGWRLQARRGREFLIPSDEEPPPQEAPLAPAVSSVRAGMVGVFRASEKPLRAGDPVAPGATVGNIDSMGILNPVTVEEAGFVTGLLVEDGDPVEYGQELLSLSPEPPPDEELR
jgi:biotin carboxyl carrier protein